MQSIYDVLFGSLNLVSNNKKLFHLHRIFFHCKTELSCTCTFHWNVTQRILGGARQRETLFIKWSYMFLYQRC